MTSITDQPREAGHCETAGVAVLSVAANESETLMLDTINTGTRLIGEGTVLPKSVQYESEPWTAFYIAGEIIRELRKAQEIKKIVIPALRNEMSKAA
jgi:hypothetical protein